MFGVVAWVAIAAGAWVLSAAEAPRSLVAVYAVLAVAGFVVFGVRSTRS